MAFTMHLDCNSDLYSIIGQRIHGATWTRFSHHGHDFSDYYRAVDAFCELARVQRSQQVAEARNVATGQRISRIKSEDRPFKATEKLRIFESPLYEELDNTVGPCHHRDVLGEDERKLWRTLPTDDWRRSTVFKGLSLKAVDDKIKMGEILIDCFDVAPDIVAACSRDKLDTLWRDQVSKKYIPMSKVCRL